MTEVFRMFLLCFLLVLLGVPADASSAQSAGVWSDTTESGQLRLKLYFFWSQRCPHCLEAKPVVEQLATELPWLQLHSLEVSQHPEQLQRYINMAESLGYEARSVPAFLFCGQMEVGFDGDANRLKAALTQCYQRLQQGLSIVPTSQAAMDIPLIGELGRDSHSLLFVTMVIAMLDAFNPCAFFVLLFLLSLLVHSRSRKRMLFIGGIFVFFSGAIYFLFMAAWLNLFLLAGMQRVFTYAAGLLAVVMALINIKDFFLPGRGVSLSISEQNKPGLFQHMRDMLQATNLATLTVATITLAVAANSYELLCTSGLPMVYTRVLTLESLDTADYYLYLLLYNLIYVTPLLLIVVLFSLTLGRHKMQPEEGRLLKLLSGLMMLELGAGLLFAPELISSLGVVLLAMSLALGVTLSAALWLRKGH